MCIPALKLSGFYNVRDDTTEIMITLNGEL